MKQHCFSLESKTNGRYMHMYSREDRVGEQREKRRTFVALRNVQVLQLRGGVDELEDRGLRDPVQPDHSQRLQTHKSALDVASIAKQET